MSAEEALPARVHDYRTGRRTWGHNLEIRRVEDGPGDARGHMFAGRAERGDHVLWSTAYGHAVARILEIRTPMDPGDMHFVTLEIIRRHGLDGEILP